MHNVINDNTIDDIIESVANPKFDIKIEVRRRDRWRHNTDKHRDYFSPTKIYLFPKGESTFGHLMNRKSRPFKFYRKQIIPIVLKKLNWDPKTLIRWSQYAGCSCPCSPGFRVNEYIKNHPIKDGWYDIFVSINDGTGETTLVKTKWAKDAGIIKMTENEAQGN